MMEKGERERNSSKRKALKGIVIFEINEEYLRMYVSKCERNGLCDKTRSKR